MGNNRGLLAQQLDMSARFAAVRDYKKAWTTLSSAVTRVLQRGSDPAQGDVEQEVVDAVRAANEVKEQMR